MSHHYNDDLPEITFFDDNRVIVLKNTILIQYGWVTYNSSVSRADDMTYNTIIINLFTSYKRYNSYYVDFSCENSNYTVFKLEGKSISSFRISCRSLAFTYNDSLTSGDENFTIYSVLDRKCLDNNSPSPHWGLSFEGSNPIHWFTIGSK